MTDLDIDDVLDIDNAIIEIDDLVKTCGSLVDSQAFNTIRVEITKLRNITKERRL
jgi:hypothetical protein